MFSTAVVTFREVLEIALVLGVILAATKGLPKRGVWIWVGMLGGVVGSILLALFAETISNAAEGVGQELFNATVLFIAATMIGWTVLWMKKHGRAMAKRAKQLGVALMDGQAPLYSLSVVVALAVLREGSEIVLFTYGVAAAGQSLFSIVSGLILGMISGSMVGVMIYYGLIRISPRYLFTVISWLLILVAAGMMSVSAKYLAAAGYFSALSSPLWDSSSLLSEGSVLGQVLHALLGYSAQPLGIQLVFYTFTLGVLIMTMRWMDRQPISPTMQAAAKLSSISLVALVCGYILLQPVTSLAAVKVYDPYVIKGELELEWRNRIDVDSNDDAGGSQQEKLAVGYGVTDRWFTEVYGEAEKEGQDGSDYEFTALEWENKFQLTERGEYFVDVGLLTEYEVSLEDGGADKAEVALLLAKDTGKFTHYANFSLEQEVGSNAEGGTGAGFKWSTRYRLSPQFEPGFEVHSDFGALNQSNPYDEQEHYIGPAFYGKVGPVRYDVGYLFGISDAASDGVFKSVIEYEKYF